MEIYIDASGDPGLTKKYISNGSSSSFYCLGVVAIEENTASILIQKMRENYQNESGMKLPKELKYSKLKPKARDIVLGILSKSNAQMTALCLKKLIESEKEIPDFCRLNMRKFNQKLLSLLIHSLFEWKHVTHSKDEIAEIIFDEGIHENYSNELKRQVRKYSYKIRIRNPVRSHLCYGVQLADLIAGSFSEYVMSENKTNAPFLKIKEKCNLIEGSFERLKDEVSLKAVLRMKKI
jgi:hypothetical protein